MSRLRIAIDARLESGLEGGVEQYLIGLAHGLGSLTDGNEEYLFLVYAGHGDWLRPYLGGNSSLLEAPAPRPQEISTQVRSWAGARIPSARRAWRWFDRYRPERLVEIPESDGTVEGAGADLVHFATQRGFLTDLPTIYQPWDLQHLHVPAFFSPATRRWREATYRALCAHARLIVVASGWAKRDIGRRYDIEEGRIVVVPPPPPVKAYPLPRKDDVLDIRRRHGLPERYLIYPAQTWQHKNHLRLISAVAQLRDRQGMAVSIICPGRRTPHYRAIRAALRRTRLEDQVRFLGFVPPSHMVALYQLSGGLIFPSLFEGWGLPVVEAFALGVPVACAATTSLPDLVGDAALLFDPTDVPAMATAIGALWSDQELGRTLAARGRIIADRLDWSETAALMRSHYRQTVAGSTARETMQATP